MNISALMAGSLGRRVASGFIVVLALTGASIGLYHTRVAAMRDNVSALLQSGTVWRDTSRFALDLEEARLGVASYLRSERALDLVNAQHRFDVVRADLASIVATHVAGTEQFPTLLDAYSNGLANLVELVRKKQAASGAILTQGGASSQHFTALASEAVANQLPLAPLAMRLSIETNRLIAAANRFYSTTSPSDQEMMVAERERLLTDIALVRDATAGLSPDITARTQAAVTHATKLIDATATLEQVFRTMQTGREDVIRTAGTLRQHEAAVLDAVRKDQEALAASTIATANRALSLGLLGFGIAMTASILAAIVISRGLSRSIARITGTMARLSQGDLTVTISDTGRQDEIGAMARAVEVFKRNAEQAKTAEAAIAREREEAAEERRAALNAMADRLESDVKQVAERVATAAEGLHGSAGAVTKAVGDTTTRSQAAARGAETATEQAQLVAAAAEQLTASIAEINRQVAGCTEIAVRGVEQARRTGATMGKLATAASEIGQVISLVDEIADQTKLLALNATIEAMRAGSAGKGFSVVASEVKSLAAQTARATEDISRRVSSIQAESNAARSAIEEVAGTIAAISAAAATIAEAVGEQSAATGEISSSIQQAAAGTREATRNIVDVLTATSDAAMQAGQVESASDVLVAQSSALETSLQGFLKTVRA